MSFFFSPFHFFASPPQCHAQTYSSYRGNRQCFVDYSFNIADFCNFKNESYVRATGHWGYECHPQYKSSLYVNTAGPLDENHFYVMEYEVYTIDNYIDYVYESCKHPDIILDYLKAKDVSPDSLKHIEDDVELFNDLDAINCYDYDIRWKIHKLLLIHPSQYLPRSQIVDMKYDRVLRTWIGEYRWNLIYRASEHKFNIQSFIDRCKGKGPTIIVLKSINGFIFGAYIAQPWRLETDDPCMIYMLFYDSLAASEEGSQSFLFVLRNINNDPPAQVLFDNGNSFYIKDTGYIPPPYPRPSAFSYRLAKSSYFEKEYKKDYEIKLLGLSIFVYMSKLSGSWFARLNSDVVDALFKEYTNISYYKYIRSIALLECEVYGLQGYSSFFYNDVANQVVDSCQIL